jgi:hypothetical protein
MFAATMRIMHSGKSLVFPWFTDAQKQRLNMVPETQLYLNYIDLLIWTIHVIFPGRFFKFVLRHGLKNSVHIK